MNESEYLMEDGMMIIDVTFMTEKSFSFDVRYFRGTVVCAHEKTRDNNNRKIIKIL
jgi:hypothetical protein